MAWQKEATETLSSTVDIITATVSDKKFYTVMTHEINSGASQNTPRLGNGGADAGSNYAVRFSRDGGADTAQASQTQLGGTQSASSPSFQMMYIFNLSGEEKLVILNEIVQNTAGAGTAPKRTEQVGKWVNTSNPIDTIQAFNADSGSFTNDSNISVLGTD